MSKPVFSSWFLVHRQKQVLATNCELKTQNFFHQAGITFIELLLVVSLISTIGVLSSSFLGRFYQQSSVLHTADQLVSTFRKAQVYSMMSRLGDSWSVNYSSNTITLFKGTNFGSRDPSYDEKFNVTTNTSISGLSTISFNRMSGVPTSTLTVTVTGGDNNTENITMNAQGAVSR